MVGEVEASEEEILSAKQFLLNGWHRKRLEEKRTVLHLSDTLYCRRKSAFSYIDSLPPKPNDRKLKYFIGGEIIHGYLEKLLGPEFDCEKSITFTLPNGLNIVATPE